LSKKIIVFGATGKLGQQILRQALDAAFDVTAFVRDPAKLTIQHPRLRVVTGDTLDADSVERGLAGGYDAALSALGVFHREPRTELSDGTANIIRAMQKHRVTRLVVVSSVGAGDSKGQGNLLARGLQQLLLKHVLADKDRQEALVAASGLEWTILRPPQLTDEPTARADLVAWSGPPTRVKKTWKTSRASVARAALEAVSEGKYLRQAVNISDPA
jgi:putative NADH-flavin reductase